MSHSHHVDVKTISNELNTAKTAIGFLSQADLLVGLNAIATARGLPTPFLIPAANSLIAQGNQMLSTLPNSSGLTSSINLALNQGINSGGVDRGTATLVVQSLNDVLPLPPNSLSEFPSRLTFLNAAGKHAAVHRDPHIDRQLASKWNQPFNFAAAEDKNLLGDFLHYRAAGFSATSAISATINDIQNNHVT